MENLYKELRSFFANDIDLNDLFDSEAIIWIDWREYDEDVVRYFNDMMAEPINLESNMFNLDMDEVSALLELRENNR